MPAEKTGKFIELPTDLVAATQQMCERYGTTFTFEVVDALRRHVAYPPERKPEPLPDTGAEPVPPKKPGPKKPA